jgi:6-phosphogluconolactonase (cycloisomerase 2 family)
MKLSLFGRMAMALFASLALGLGMTACGGGTIGYMYVLGQQYNQIAGFKIDDYSGNLTQTAGTPYSSGGSVPVSLVIKPGGRYVYVLNQGVGGDNTKSGSGAGISVFSVGGDGVLTFQQSYTSQGYIPQWMERDTTGTYLYVLDKYSPSYDAANGRYDLPNTDGNGSITVFSIDSTTGRLTLVTNTSVLKNNIATPFFEVGPSPFMMKQASSCLFTVNSANQTVTPYAIGTAGQLVIESPGQYVTGAVSATSITSGGSYVLITDSNNGNGTGNVQFYTVGGNCNLSPISSGYVGIPGTSNPTWAFIDGTGKYLYVLNKTTTSTQTTTPYSSISAYSFTSNTNQVQALPDAPYSVGSGPVCMVQDPTSQYMYISDYNDGTVTGKFFNNSTGQLSQLKRGSTFPAVGLAGCLAVSGSVE